MGQSLLSAAWVLFFVFVFVFPKKTKIFIWLRRIPVATCGVFSCSMWDLASPPGVGLGLPGWGKRGPSYWTAREAPTPRCLAWMAAREVEPRKTLLGPESSSRASPASALLPPWSGQHRRSGQRRWVSSDGLASADGSAQTAWPA